MKEISGLKNKFYINFIAVRKIRSYLWSASEIDWTNSFHGFVMYWGKAGKLSLATFRKCVVTYF